MIVNCKECGKEMSDSAKACPNCGYDYTVAKKAKSKRGCGIALGLLLAFFLLFMFLGQSDEEAKEKKGIALKEAHCKVEWIKLKNGDREKILKEFMENALYMYGVDAPEVRIKTLLKNSVKYPGTIEEEYSPIREIKDIRKGIIEYQNPFTAENKLGQKVKGHYWMKVQYNGGCKTAEIISFKVE